MINKKNILITGGFGFIGFNLLCKLLKDERWNLIVIDNLSSYSAKNNIKNLPSKDLNKIHFIKCDISNFRNYKNFNNIDCIIHLAAELNQQKALENHNRIVKTNIIGTLNILEFARQNKCPIILSSSIKVYSDWLNEIKYLETSPTRYIWQDTKDIDEDFSLDKGHHSRGIYGVTKYIVENLCQEYFNLFHVPIIINRKSSIYGYWQYGSSGYGWLWHFIENAIRGKEIKIYGSGKQVRDVLFINDLIDLYLKQIEYLIETKKPVFEIYNIGGGYQNSISLLEALEIIKSLTKSKPKIKFFDSRPSDLKIFITNIKKVSGKFKWSPKTSTLDGIKFLFSHINDIIK